MTLPTGIYPFFVGAVNMIARTKFKKGDRVKMTRVGRQAFPDLRKPTGYIGVVVGFPRYETGVRVKRDGYKGVENWHMSFWRVVNS